MFIDSHCHMDFPDLALREGELLANMRQQKVSHALCVSVNIEQWPRVIGMATRHDNIFASVGVHPDQPEGTVLCVADLVSRAADPKVDVHRRNLVRRRDEEVRDVLGLLPAIPYKLPRHRQRAGKTQVGVRIELRHHLSRSFISFIT